MELSAAAGQRQLQRSLAVASADALSLPREHLLVCDTVTPEPAWGAVMHATWTTTYEAPRKVHAIQTPAPGRRQVLF